MFRASSSAIRKIAGLTEEVDRFHPYQNGYWVLRLVRWVVLMSKHHEACVSRQTSLVSNNDSLGQITIQMREFTRVRDWHQFHDPKSLMLALVGEVGELSELLQWIPAQDAHELAQQEPLNHRLGEEMSDVLLYLVRLADVCGVDLGEAVADKLAANEQRFLVTDVHGEAPLKE
jgi:dCTP diphosphatase